LVCKIVAAVYKKIPKRFLAKKLVGVVGTGL
jgi:hypothetical protein